MKHTITEILRFLLVGLLTLPATAFSSDVFTNEPGDPVAIRYAEIAIIIDDIGIRLDDCVQSLLVPGALTYSIMPHTPHGKRLARVAHELGKEVMLHLPMEAIGNPPQSARQLTTAMSETAFRAEVQQSLADIPYTVGINNHMGSLLTQRQMQMRWLMDVLNQRGDLFFVDSRTTPRSIAHAVAHDFSIPTQKRDIFLDHDANEAAISGQFDKLIEIAQRRGRAIAIGHPYPETTRVLKARLPELADHGIRLVPVSALLKRPTRVAHAPLTDSDGKLSKAAPDPSPWLPQIR